MNQGPHHSQPVDDLLQRLAVDPAQGLTETEAQGRLDENGPNALQKA